MADHVSISSNSALETHNIGVSLAQKLYRLPVDILLNGELGAGKTQLSKGIALGLGVQEEVVSPSYALEQQYGAQLTHIDVYRLSSGQAAEFLEASEACTGVRIVEWANRLPSTWSSARPRILVEIAEPTRETRTIDITFADVAIPAPELRKQWMEDVGLPEHIRKHTHTVAATAMRLADALLSRGVVVRKAALQAAAELHDLLRFCDFKSLTGDALYTPSAEQSKRWQTLKEAYGTPHEVAAERFLTAEGYPEIGAMVSTHGLQGCRDERLQPKTLEQKLLCYSDKRVMFDTVVTLQQRFDDFLVRYGNGKETAFSQASRTALQHLERELFPDGPPF